MNVHTNPGQRADKSATNGAMMYIAKIPDARMRITTDISVHATARLHALRQSHSGCGAPVPDTFHRRRSGPGGVLCVAISHQRHLRTYHKRQSQMRPLAPRTAVRWPSSSLIHQQCITPMPKPGSSSRLTPSGPARNNLLAHSDAGAQFHGQTPALKTPCRRQRLQGVFVAWVNGCRSARKQPPHDFYGQTTRWRPSIGY